MNPKELKGLIEAYQQVYAPQEELEMGKEELELDENRAAMGRIAREYKKNKEEEGMKKRIADHADKMKNDPEYAAKRRAQDKIHREELEQIEELHKGRHGQSEKEYQDSRSDAGKMVSGDSKMSGSRYAQGRRTSSDAGAQPAGGSKKPESQGKMDSGSRIDLQFRKAALKKKEAVKNEELSVFDTVLEYLQVEGIVESVEDAEWMMVNVLEEGDVDSILDEARRSDKEGYEKGSKENPKRNDIPHRDVSQRSMLHSKLKRRATEMGRDRRSSARNKAGGRTPLSKKEKSFLQAADRTAQQVRNPNVPDTGKHNK